VRVEILSVNWWTFYSEFVDAKFALSHGLEAIKYRGCATLCAGDVSLYALRGLLTRRDA
jgi:hypothetical protein